MRHIILALALVFGLGNAQASIEDLYQAEDYDAALAQARQEAAAGDPKAHDWLGWMIEQGRGTEPDPQAAAEHYRVAAAAGRNHARWRLGVLMDEGRIAGGSGQAVALFRLAAAENYANALVSLGVMHATGRGTPKDFDAAYASYERAARLGDAGGMRGVAVMHYLGEGRPVDKAEAAAWFLLSAALGNEEARSNAEQVAGELGAADLEGVEDRAFAIAAELGLDMGE
ncbi:tetratricopeptide repeat protein [Erythrobacter sp.]|uniref:tetratricopeptide repeat protein n=1 Tax=Erythrobacter sp. TaxID=1042 RepID=UPI001425ECD9|nr:tetratricopeptide repeat protein [Erythrobacter sp.]QIQ87308.1 MAG: sel1 repeat family protein [Erythrobacter sp.]